MILTSDSTWVRVANTPTGNDTFISIYGYSIGEHGGTYGDEEIEEQPAGNPLQEDVDWTFDPLSFPAVGSKYSIWLGRETGSYHERFIKIQATVGNSEPVKFKGHNVWPESPKIVGTFKFSGIEDCCKRIVSLTGCLPPESEELSSAIPPKQDLTPVAEPDQANPRRPGETSEQYWKRISLEKRGKFYYPGEGGIEREF